MFYREAGEYKTTYAADMAIFPIRQDRYGVALILVVAFLVIPAFGNQFFLNTMMIPFLILSLGAIGLNLLTGYTGLLSLGTGAFMGVGAYACYKLETIFPQVNILVWIIASGLVSALVGVVFGLPSLRIKGFYLAVATLAAQFFLQWCFARVPWLVNYNNSGAIEVPTQTLFGLPVTGPTATPATRYLVVADHRRRDGLDRLQHRARADRTHVDGGARHGHRRGTHRHPPVARQAARLRGVVVLRRRRRRHDGVPLVRGGGARGVQHRSLVPDPVHDHHRRTGLDRRRLSRRRRHPSHADRAARRAGDGRPLDRRGDGSTS